MALRTAGQTNLGIARLTGLDRRTVDTWLAAGQFPERTPASVRPTCVDAFADFLAARVAAGEENAAQLTRELVAHGYGGNYQAVRRLVVTASGGVAPPTGGRRAGVAQRRQGAYVTRLCEQCPELGEARVLAAQFAAMCGKRDPNTLAPWLDDARGTVLQSFVTGIERDRDAVLAALCFRWSTGQVEGHVQRLKVMKRSMYGRAKFDLLRKRVLHAA